MKDHFLVVPVLEIIICSQWLVPPLPLLFPYPINIECDHGIFFEQGDMDKIDSRITPWKIIGKCVLLFALFVLTSDTREHYILAELSFSMSPRWRRNMEQFKIVTEFRASALTQSWHDMNNKYLVIITLSLLFCNIT